MERRERLPALTVSALLHGGLLALAFLALPKPSLPPILRNEAVPVTVVSSAPEANVRPAAKAPTHAPAAAPEPAPTPEPPVAVERPTPPAPPPPAPVAKARPKPPAAKPVPAEPVPAPMSAAPAPTPAPAPKPVAKARPTPELDLGQLVASLPKGAKARPQSFDLGAIAASNPKGARAARSLDLDSLASTLPAGGSRHAAGVKGAARPETAAQARPAVGAATALSGDVKGALAAKLIRLWNLECSVPGSDTIVVRVNIRIGQDGSLAGPPTLVGITGEASDSVRQAAGVRAVSAVSRGAPYTEVPAAQRRTLNNFNFNFDAKQACR